ncbi:uncharacterized protein LOC143041445 isoform X2 [Oratosquilla oratoria]|uniref:uncharacterized protein LOC143041445 isoform X2 n=1 Tax=Oratosquilla oratoria TaxID=337810 RepID=UPI003F76FC16
MNALLTRYSCAMTMATVIYVIFFACAAFSAANEDNDDNNVRTNITTSSSPQCSSTEDALARYIEAQTTFTEAQLVKERIQEKMFIKQTEFFAAQRDFFQVKQKGENESLAEVGGLLGALELLTSALKTNFTSEEVDEMVNAHYSKRRQENKDPQPTESTEGYTVEKRLSLMEQEMSVMRTDLQSVGVLQGIIKELLHDMAAMSKKIFTLEEALSRQETSSTPALPKAPGPGALGEPPKPPTVVLTPPPPPPLPPMVSCAPPYVAAGLDCVFLSPKLEKWRMARYQCLQVKGDLFVPNPMELIEYRLQPLWRDLADPHSMLLDYLEEKRKESKESTLTIWLGGSDQDFDGRVEWLTGEQVTYADSFEDLGNNNSGRCLMLLLESSGRWKVATLSCSSQKRFLCKIK